MKNFYNIFGIIAIGAVIIAGLAGCDTEVLVEKKEPEGGKTGKSAISLTDNTWTNGSIIPASSGGDGEQWFKFTATASNQNIHISFGTMTSMDVQLYNSNNEAVGENTNFYGSNGNSTYISRNVASGQDYYIKVVSPSYHYGYSLSGTYKITFNALPFAPGTTAATLTSDTWKDSTLTSSNNTAWFKFTATAATQYIHVSFGTLTDLYVRLYDSNGNALGDSKSLYGSTAYTSLSVISGQDYYVRITQGDSYGYSHTGTYKIGFNAMPLSPGTLTAATTLTADAWVDSALTSSNNTAWFKFTATAATHYIHVSFGTLTDLYVRLYDSNGDVLGNSKSLYGSTTYTSLSVISGQDYYVRITQGDSYGYSHTGTYKIGFNAMPLSPGTSTAATMLTADVWSGGNLASSSSEQWFRFIATTGTQYIHVSFGTLTDLYVRLYDSNGSTYGSPLGDQKNLYGSIKYTSLSVTNGQEYYIKVTPYSSNSGTYQIAFNTLTTAPQQ